MTRRPALVLESFGGQRERERLGLQALRLQASVRLDHQGAAQSLRIEYRLNADFSETPTAILLPPAAPAPARRDGLWEHSCLEAFVADASQRAYWELNLAPSGHWAVYRFSDYRSGQQAAAGAAPRLAVEREGGSLALQLQWPLPLELAQASELAIGITAVLEQRNGTLSYWALHHPGPQADFHRRDGFILRGVANGDCAAPPPPP